MNRFAAAPLTLIVISLGIAACGGGDDDGPSKADFAADAEKICQNAEKQLANVGENVSTPDEIAAAVDKVIDETQQSVDELKDLKRPDGDAGKAAEEFVNALESDIQDKGIPALEDLRDAVKDNDQKAAQAAAKRLQELETTDSNKLAKDLGIDACAN